MGLDGPCFDCKGSVGRCQVTHLSHLPQTMKSIQLAETVTYWYAMGIGVKSDHTFAWVGGPPGKELEHDDEAVDEVDIKAGR